MTHRLMNLAPADRVGKALESDGVTRVTTIKTSAAALVHLNVPRMMIQPITYELKPNTMFRKEPRHTPLLSKGAVT